MVVILHIWMTGVIVAPDPSRSSEAKKLRWAIEDGA